MRPSGHIPDDVERAFTIISPANGMTSPNNQAFEREGYRK
jgi:hypothetical protein